MGDSYNVEHSEGGIVAQGPRAIGYQQIAPQQEEQEIRELINLLRRELEAHADEVADADAIRDSADSLEKELLATEQPSSGTIRMLSGMASAAGQVASVVDAIARIQRLVAPML